MGGASARPRLQRRARSRLRYKLSSSSSFRFLSRPAFLSVKVWVTSEREGAAAESTGRAAERTRPNPKAWAAPPPPPPLWAPSEPWAPRAARKHKGKGAPTPKQEGAPHKDALRSLLGIDRLSKTAVQETASPRQRLWVWRSSPETVLTSGFGLCSFFFSAFSLSTFFFLSFPVDLFLMIQKQNKIKQPHGEGAQGLQNKNGRLSPFC